MTVKPHSHNAKILDALRDGKWHSRADLQRRVGSTVSVPTRISELRSKHGFVIEHEYVEGKPRLALGHRYRMRFDVSKHPLPDPEPLAVKKRTILDRDSVPRDKAHRYRLYRVYRGKQELVAAFATPEKLGVGLIKLGEDDEFTESCVGILDTHAIPKDDKGKGQGTWILNPYDTEPVS